jgi:hypothetical protein
MPVEEAVEESAAALPSVSADGWWRALLHSSEPSLSADIQCRVLLQEH